MLEPTSKLAVERVFSPLIKVQIYRALTWPGSLSEGPSLTSVVCSQWTSQQLFRLVRKSGCANPPEVKHFPFWPLHELSFTISLMSNSTLYTMSKKQPTDLYTKCRGKASVKEKSLRFQWNNMMPLHARAEHQLSHFTTFIDIFSFKLLTLF